MTAQVQDSPTGDLCLRYRLQAPKLSAWRLPPLQPPGPGEDLWQHTCFEAFVGKAHDSAYHEFNFSPSRQWAHYAFCAERVRAPMGRGLDVRLGIGLQIGADELALQATVPRAALPDLFAPLRLGLSAVLEGDDGTLHYWALEHPASRPDFHHPLSRCVALAWPSPFDLNP